MKADEKIVALYASHSVNKAGTVKITLKAGYDQLSQSVMLLRMIQENITVKVKLLDRKPFLLGTFKLDNLSFDKNGISTIKLSSFTEAIDSDKLADLVTMNLMQIKFEAEIEASE